MRKLAISFLAITALGIFLTVPAANADTIVGSTSRATFAGNDSVDWSQLGASLTPIPNPFTATSTGGVGVTGAFAGSGDGQVRVQGTSQFADFAAGDFLVAAFCAGGTCPSQSGGQGPLTLTFNTPVTGAGAQIENDFRGAFSAEIQAYNGSTLLGSFTETGTVVGCLTNGCGDNTAMFLGIEDLSGANITSVVFSNPTCNPIGDCAAFEINTLALQTTSSSTVPEPTTLVLAACGLGALLTRKRFRRILKEGRREDI
jgi:hypothetical protein